MQARQWTQSLGSLLVVAVAAAVLLTPAQNAVADRLPGWADQYYDRQFDSLDRQERYSKEALEAEFESHERALERWYRAERARLEWEKDRLDDLSGPAAAQMRAQIRAQLRALEDDFERRRDALEDRFEDLEECLERRYEQMSDSLELQREAHEAALRYAPRTAVAPAVIWAPSRPAARRAVRSTSRALRRCGPVWIYH